ncbi:MAG TPA: AI-2E family transporter [Thermoanaerobaculia bacterium]
MPTTSRFASRVFALASIAVILYLLAKILRPFLGPLVWSALIAFVLYPLYKRLRNRWPKRKDLPALVMTVGVALGLILPVIALLAVFAGQAADLVSRVGEMARTYSIRRPEDVVRLPFLSNLIGWISAHSTVTTEEIQGWLVRASQGLLSGTVENITGLFRGILGFVVDIGLTLFILYFFFRDGATVASRGVLLLPLDEERRESLLNHLSSVTRAVVYGTLLTALAQGALVGIGWAIVGLPSAIVFGVVACITSLLPVVGTALVWVPGVLVLIAQRRFGAAIFLALWALLIVGLADNVLRPLLISGKAEIATLPVFLGVVGGLTAFGVIGVFLGPLVIALALALINFAHEARGMPSREELPGPAPPAPAPP